MKGVKSMNVNIVIEKIKEQSKEYEQHSNNWNVANQLIDIVAVSTPESVEIIYRDLDISEMTVQKLADSIIGERMCNPVEVMKTICNFYKIPTPKELPPEHWRGQARIDSKSKLDVSLTDLM